MKNEIETLKTERKKTPRHITTDELPEQDQFRQLSTSSKQLMDTIKMIAYRAETAMANLLRETITRPDEARTLLRSLYQTEADLLPDYEAGTLTVRLHHMASRCNDVAIQKMCDELNEMEMLFPGTDLRLVMKLGS